MSATLIAKALASTGATADQIAAAIEAYETPIIERQAQKRENARQRQIRLREKKESFNNNCHITHYTRDSALQGVTVRDTPSPLVPPSNGFPTPLPITPPYNPPSLEVSARDALPTTPKELKKSKRAERLSKEWVLPTEWGKWAMDEEGLTYEEVIRQEDIFRDHWFAKPGGDACKSDWQATWRNWIRRSKVGFK